MLFIESYAFFCLIKPVCLYGGLIHNMETKIWTQVRGCATTPYKAIQTSKTPRRNLKTNVGFFCTWGEKWLCHHQHRTQRHECGKGSTLFNCLPLSVISRFLLDSGHVCSGVVAVDKQIQGWTRELSKGNGKITGAILFWLSLLLPGTGYDLGLLSCVGLWWATRFSRKHQIPFKPLYPSIERDE